MNSLLKPRSGGQILVDGLIQFGIKTVFCVPGESYLAALDGFYERRDSIQLITCRQEGGAAYMAEAWGKKTGQPGVCFVTRGPGATNAMIGVHTAFQDSTPMLLFVGQVSTQDTDREAFQELDYAAVYGGVAKSVIRIEKAERIPEHLQKAYSQAMSGRPGPVVVVLPEDMLRVETNVEDPTCPRIAKAAPSMQDIVTCADMISQAESPLLICGGAGWSDEASHHLHSFSDTTGIPVVSCFRRQDCFDNHHDHFIGELGIAANPQLLERVEQSDLLIVIGPRLGEMTTGGYSLFDIPKPKQTLIHVFCSADEINSVYHADLPIVSDPAEFLSTLNQYADKCQLSTQQIESVSRSRKQYLEFMTGEEDTDADICLESIMQFLRERLPSNSILTNGAGNYTRYPQRHYQFQQPRTQLAPTNGSMGYGVPAGIAAKLASPNSIVVSFSGDGCFMMNGQELATAVQYGINTLFLIINNSRYGTIRSHQDRHYPGRPVGTDLNNPNFAELAMAYGAHGETIRYTHEFEAAFERAISSQLPAVIELITT